MTFRLEIHAFYFLKFFFVALISKFYKVILGLSFLLHICRLTDMRNHHPAILLFVLDLEFSRNNCSRNSQSYLISDYTLQMKKNISQLVDSVS